MRTPSFWPLDLDWDEQIYDKVAWDLPGLRRRLREKRKSTKRLTRKTLAAL